MSSSARAAPQAPGVEVRGEWGDGYEQVLTEQSLSLLAQLQREFGGRRRDLLELRGVGAVAICNRMEDAAKAESSRSQIWQWVHNGVPTAEGTAITPEWMRTVEVEELEKVRAAVGGERFSAGRYDEARALVEQVALADEFEQFLTLPVYERLG
jgi:malate synthase